MVIVRSLSITALSLLVAVNAVAKQKGFSAVVNTEPSTHTKQLAPVFDSLKVEGTLVIQRLGSKELTIHAPNRAVRPFSPASTFKIPNTLIGLEYKVVTSPTSVFKWDKQQRWLDTWNQDHTLQSAYKVSCVWCYQHLARQLNLTTYKTELAKLQYGNQNPGSQIDQFWLNGDLTISALEQVEFLIRLIENRLPYQTHLQNLTKEIMLERVESNYKIYAKTGWAAGDINVGWYVGYIETVEGIWVFAMNMDLSDIQKAPLRKQVVMQALSRLKII